MSCSNYKHICIGIITGAHGIKGMVKIKSFAQDHRNLANYKKIFNDSTHFTIEVQSARGDVLIARVEGVNDRNAAEALAQTRLYIDREELSPTKQNEFYISDLIGMEVVDTHNSDVGIVAGVHNFGGGDIVEVQLIDQSKRMLLFNTENFPEVDLITNKMKVVFSKPQVITTEASDLI